MLHVIQTKYQFDRKSTDNCRKDSLVSSLTFTWVLLDLVFWFSDTNYAYKTVFEKIMYIARFSPVFCMAIVSRRTGTRGRVMSLERCTALNSENVLVMVCKVMLSRDTNIS